MLIRDVEPRLHEMGKIKIGKKEEKVREAKQSGRKYQRPMRLDYIFLTTLEKDEFDNFIEDKEMTEKVTKERNKDGKPVCIGSCVFLFDKIESNLLTAYQMRSASKIHCRGDGETASRLKDNKEREDVECKGTQCQYFKDKKCKATCVLSVVFPDAPRAGGVYRFRSSGLNSTITLQSEMFYFYKWTGGKMAGIPFNLRLNRKESEVDGKTESYYYLALEYDDSLRELANNPQRLTVPKELPVGKEEAVQEALMLKEADSDLDEFHPEADPSEEAYQKEKDNTEDLKKKLGRDQKPAKKSSKKPDPKEIEDLEAESYRKALRDKIEEIKEEFDNLPEDVDSFEALLNSMKVKRFEECSEVQLELLLSAMRTAIEEKQEEPEEEDGLFENGKS